MVRLICGLILVLAIATPSMGQQSLVGTYKIVSFIEEMEGTTIENMGKCPTWLPHVYANSRSCFLYYKREKTRHLCG